MPNHFTQKYSEKPTKELINIVESNDSYAAEARLAAFELLGVRGEDVSNYLPIKEKILNDLSEQSKHDNDGDFVINWKNFLINRKELMFTLPFSLLGFALLRIYYVFSYSQFVQEQGLYIKLTIFLILNIFFHLIYKIEGGQKLTYIKLAQFILAFSILITALQIVFSLIFYINPSLDLQIQMNFMLSILAFLILTSLIIYPAMRYIFKYNAL